MPEITGRRIEARCGLLEEKFAEFKQYAEGGQFMELDRYALYSAVVSYFHDVERHKRFHEIVLIDTVKQAGFTIKWIAKFRPIRFSWEEEVSDSLQHCNEIFAVRCGLGFMKLLPMVLPPELTTALNYTLRNRNVDERMLFIWLETLKRAVDGDFLEHTH